MRPRPRCLVALRQLIQLSIGPRARHRIRETCTLENWASCVSSLLLKEDAGNFIGRQIQALPTLCLESMPDFMRSLKVVKGGQFFWMLLVGKDGSGRFWKVISFVPCCEMFCLCFRRLWKGERRDWNVEEVTRGRVRGGQWACEREMERNFTTKLLEGIQIQG